MKRERDEDPVFISKRTRLDVDLGGLAEFWQAMLRPWLDMDSRAKCRRLSRQHCEWDKLFVAPRWMQRLIERYSQLALYERLRQELRPYLELLYSGSVKPYFETKDEFHEGREWEIMSLVWQDRNVDSLHCNVRVIPLEGTMGDTAIEFDWEVTSPVQGRLWHPFNLTLHQLFEALRATGRLSSAWIGKYPGV